MLNYRAPSALNADAAIGTESISWAGGSFSPPADISTFPYAGTLSPSWALLIKHKAAFKYEAVTVPGTR